MKKLLLFIAFAIFGLGLNAQNVGDETTIDYDGYSLEFEITSVSPAECRVSDYTGEPTDVTIPSTITISGTEFAVTSIGGGAFDGCSSLTSIEIPNSVTSIGDGAFRYCSSLTSIVVEEGNTVYDSRESCNAIIKTETNTLISGCQNTTIPNSVTSIGSSAFSGCSSLTSIEIPNSVTSIEYAAFSSCSSLTSIEIPNSVTYIGGYAFLNCSSLTSVEIPNSVTFISGNAFNGCSSLTSMIVEDGNAVYDSRNNCNAIIKTETNTLISGCRNTTIPNSVTSIGYYAFSGCSSLTSIEIPNSVTSIGGGAFDDCSSLTSIEIPNSVTSIGVEAFRYCDNLASIVVAEGNTVYDSRENCNAIIETETNTLISGCQNTTIPNSVTSIGNRAFLGCHNLTSIEIPNSATSIGEDAFGGCYNLTSIEIPNSVTSIGEGAFSHCSSLTNIEIPNSVTSIGEGAFWGCSSLRVIKCYAENVPETEDDVFYYCPTYMRIYVPEASLEDYRATYPWNEFIILPLNDNEDEGEYLVYEDFEDLLAGDKLAEKSHSFWTTWNKKPGTAEDAEIVELDGNKCAHMTYGVDQVLLLGGYTSGRYEIEFDLYVPAGNCAYYNILHDFAGSNSDWALQQYVHMTHDGNNSTPAAGHGTTHAAGNSVADITQFVFDTWMTISYVIDIDRDVAEFYFSTEKDTAKVKLLEWQWSCNSLNDQSSLNPKLDAMDFFTPSNTSFYLDNFTLRRVSAPTIPAVPDTLFAEALSDTTVVLTWNMVDSVLGYNVYSVIDSTYTLLADSISDTTYTVKGLLPDSTYCFAVAAFNQVGESERKSVTVKTLKADDGSDDGNDNPTDTIVPEPEVLSIPENLVAKAESSSSISLSWDEVENAESYNVYRDGDSIANVTNPTYTDKDLEYNTEYCYTVTAVSGDEESEESDEECVKTLGESIEELSSSINIYPNPVENELFIATEVRVEEVSIYDIYGRQTMSQQVNETTSQQVVEVTELEAGVYFVKVVTSEGEIVKRFVKN